MSDSKKNDIKPEIQRTSEKPESQYTADQINSSRGAWQKPELVLSKLGDLSEQTVADIGAGLGYFSFQMLQSAKKVIAVDIDPNMIDFMDQFKTRFPDSLQVKFETRLAKASNPNLERVEVDLIVIINTIAYIEDKVNYLRNLKPSLKYGGRIMIMDYKMKNLEIDAPPKDQRIYLAEMEDVLEEAGFRNIISDDTSLDFQYMIFADIN